jgi:hypothetical protein
MAHESEYIDIHSVWDVDREAWGRAVNCPKCGMKFFAAARAHSDPWAEDELKERVVVHLLICEQGELKQNI